LDTRRQYEILGCLATNEELAQSSFYTAVIPPPPHDPLPFSEAEIASSAATSAIRPKVVSKPLASKHTAKKTAKRPPPDVIPEDSSVSNKKSRTATPEEEDNTLPTAARASAPTTSRKTARQVAPAKSGSSTVGLQQPAQGRKRPVPTPKNAPGMFYMLFDYLC
jgi:hypothetical protein